MNCLELRRAALVAPHHLDGHAQAHAATCAQCRAFLEETQTLERDLDATMRIPIPDGMQQRVLRQIAEPPGISRRKALAAGLFVAFGAGGH